MPLFYHTGALGDFLLAVPFLRAVRALGLEGPWTLVAQEAPAKLVGRIFPARRLAPGLLDWAPLSRGGADPEELAAFLERHGPVFGFAREAEAIEGAARRAAPSVPLVLSEPFARTTALGEEIEETLARAIAKLSTVSTAALSRRPEVAPARPRLEDFAIAPEELPPAPASEHLDLARGAPPMALVHIGASAREKLPPADILAEAARRLLARGFRVAWVRGPVEAERGIAPPAQPPLPLVDSPDILVLAHLAARAALYVGADTGPTHLAAELGVPTIAIHVRPNPLWRPRGLRARVVPPSELFSALPGDPGSRPR